MFRIPHQALIAFSLALIVLAGVLSPQLSGIHYRSEITDYFRHDDPRLKAFHQLEQQFGFQQTLIVFLQNADSSFLNPQSLKNLHVLEQQLRQISGIAKIESILGTPVTDPAQQTRTAREWLQTEQTLPAGGMAQLADAISRSGMALSADQRLATLQIHFSSTAAIQDDYDKIHHRLEQLKTAGGISRFHLLGPAEIKQALHQALLHDGIYLMPLVLLVGLGVLWWFLRSWWLVFSGAVSIMVALVITAEMVGLLGLSINQTSALAFGITFIIALADIIHLLMSYSHQQRTGYNRQAMQQSLQQNLPSLFLTSLTTAIGFLSLNGSSSPVFATFGNIAAMGVGFAFITAITITPVLAVWVAPAQNGHAGIFHRVMQWLGPVTFKRRRSRLVVFYAVTLALCCASLLNRFHNDPLDYFEADSAIRLATDTSAQHFSVHHPISVVIDSGQPDGIFTTDFARQVTAFQNWLAADPRISQQSSYLDTLQLQQQHVHEYNPKWASTPAHQQALADLWSVYEMATTDARPETLGLDHTMRRALVRVGVPRLQSGELMQLEQDIQRWFAINAPSYKVTVTGHAVLFAGIGKELTHNMVMGALLSALVISLLIGLFLGNIRLGIVSLIPNVLPAAVIFGIWGLSVGVIDIAAAGTLSISLGIVVDDTIHILKRYSGFREAGHEPPLALQQTFAQVGPALLLTTVVLGLGMLILTLSIFGPNQTTAQLMASIISLALLFDLVMLPHLLVALDGWLFRHAPVTSNAATVSPADPAC